MISSLIVKSVGWGLNWLEFLKGNIRQRERISCCISTRFDYIDACSRSPTFTESLTPSE